MTQATDPQLAEFFARSSAELADEGWIRMELHADQPLWRKGEAADSLAWVELGTMIIRLDGEELARVGPHELLGEASAFIANQPRSADVAAAEPARLWVLPRAGLSHLRGNNVRFYDMILRSAIVTIARRIADNERALSQRSRVHHGLPTSASPTLWARFRRSFERPDAAPPVAEALAALPKIPAKGVLASDIAAIAEPVWLKTGEALCLEGDPARSMYVVARGQLTAMISGGGQAIELSRVGPGALLGTAALLHEGPRTASLVAAEPTWVYELARERVERLSAGAWRLLAESLLVDMRAQLVRSSEER